MSQPLSSEPKTVLLSGASGLVGRALSPWLLARGHRVRRLVRRVPAEAGEYCWDPAAGQIDHAALAGVDAVINLAGENLAAGRWTARRCEAILRSRVDATRTLVSAFSRMERHPAVLINASATGIYGDRGDEVLTEESAVGEGFLAGVCQAWEAELAPAAELGVRTVALRTGIVLSPTGGALAKMLPAFQAGVGGRLGSGRQWMSWVALDDLLGIISHVMHRPDCIGPVNAVAPGTVTNAAFTATLGSVLHRPVVLPVPSFVLRALFGRMADETLLASTRVMPGQLQRSGYVFRLPQLEPALRHVLACKT